MERLESDTGEEEEPGRFQKDSDTSERGIVHRTWIVSAKSWVSVASSDDDDLIPSLGSTSLDKREC